MRRRLRISTEFVSDFSLIASSAFDSPGHGAGHESGPGTDSGFTYGDSGGSGSDGGGGGVDSGGG